jgi:arylsulfatase A-like enzyme
MTRSFAYGSKVDRTPHPDRLAREGALLTSVFATNSICTSSRATILTGQHSHLNGVTMFDRFLDAARVAVPADMPGQAAITATLKAELSRPKREATDDDQRADVQIPQGVDGSVQQPRGR